MYVGGGGGRRRTFFCGVLLSRAFYRAEDSPEGSSSRERVEQVNCQACLCCRSSLGHSSRASPDSGRQSSSPFCSTTQQQQPQQHSTDKEQREKERRKNLHTGSVDNNIQRDRWTSMWNIEREIRIKRERCSI